MRPASSRVLHAAVRPHPSSAHLAPCGCVELCARWRSRWHYASTTADTRPWPDAVAAGRQGGAVDHASAAGGLAQLSDSTSPNLIADVSFTVLLLFAALAAWSKANWMQPRCFGPSHQRYCKACSGSIQHCEGCPTCARWARCCSSWETRCGTGGTTGACCCPASAQVGSCCLAMPTGSHTPCCLRKGAGMLRILRQPALLGTAVWDNLPYAPQSSGPFWAVQRF